MTQADHGVVPVEPRQVTLRHHGRCDQRRYGGSDSVNAMQQTEHFVGVSHRANPCIPCGVQETISKPCKDEGYDQNGVGSKAKVSNSSCVMPLLASASYSRMHSNHNVCNQVAERTDECHSPLAKLHMNGVVE